PGQRLPVLRAVAIAGVAEGGVEHPIGPERQTSPIVEAAGGQAVEDRLGLTQGQAPRLAEEIESFDPALVTGGIEGIEFVVADGEPVEPGLTRRRDLVEAGDLAGITVGGDLEDAAGVALADQRRVPDEDDRPRSLEPAGDDLRVVVARCAGALRRIRAVSLGLRRRGGRVLRSARILGPRVRGAGRD